MSRVNKKRKLDAEEGAPWSKRKAAAFIDEAGELQPALQRCHASTFLKDLADSLEDCPPETVRRLNELISPILGAYAEPRHCVRCHEIYAEAENRTSSCAVLRGTSAVKTDLFDEDEYRMVKTKCCGRMRREKGKAEKEMVCYRTRNTINVSDVKYYKDPNRKDLEEGLKYNGYNPTVVPCSEWGCEDEELEENDDDSEEDE
ncbi:hypothetical protein FRC07_007886 [Ceratobasidium sp. 392]|nr:hypothetical protein FRC07_007886 [Ceratobasidium sp. 392]